MAARDRQVKGGKEEPEYQEESHDVRQGLGLWI
jgi:hypothetical protein